MSDKETGTSPQTTEEGSLDGPIRVKEKNPALKMIKRLSIGIVCIVVALFGFGMLSTLLDIRVPTIDYKVFLDKAQDAIDEAGSPPASPKPTPSQSVSTPAPSPTTTPTESIEMSPEPTTAAPEVPSDQSAVEAGIEAGKIFNQHKDSAEDFWRGFNAATQS